MGWGPPVAQNDAIYLLSYTIYIRLWFMTVLGCFESFRSPNSNGSNQHTGRWTLPSQTGSITQNRRHVIALSAHG